MDLLEKKLIPAGDITKIVRCPRKTAEELKKEAKEVMFIGNEKIVATTHEGKGPFCTKTHELFLEETKNP